MCYNIHLHAAIHAMNTYVIGVHGMLSVTGNLMDSFHRVHMTAIGRIHALGRL